MLRPCQYSKMRAETVVCGMRTSGLVYRHDRTPERGIRLVEVVYEGPQCQAGRDDARVTEELSAPGLCCG
jgi:hypothetical protein